MKKKKEVWRYLFKLPANIYNNDTPYYELCPFPESDHKRVFLFAGKSESLGKNLAILYVYLELTAELQDQNAFANFQRVLNLIYLETGLSIRYISIQVGASDNFDKLLSQFSSDNFFHPGVSYSGTTPQQNHISRVKACADLITKLNKKNFEKFDNSLNTFVWALELMELPNPHLKYTLYMTLFLSSIEQLVSKPATCKHRPFPICEGCGKEFDDHHPKNSGNKQAIENFIREMLTGNGVDDAVQRVNRLYRKLRSSFLHNGVLSGQEKIGGFLSSQVVDPTIIMEDMMNTLVLNRKLLEQFLVKRQTQ